MPVRFGKNSVTLEGACTVEEALPLLEYLQGHASAKVSLRACTALHSAVLLVLLAARPKIGALPDEPFLRRWIGPALSGGQP
jgi:hypothetical protein